MKQQRVLSTGLCAVLLAGVVEVGFFRKSVLAASEPVALETEVSTSRFNSTQAREQVFSDNSFSDSSFPDSSFELAQLPLLSVPRSSVQSSVAAQINDAYFLDAGDVIAINIFNVPEYSGTQQVLADGSINLPAVGRVIVRGLTPEQASETIAVAYRNELRYPQVTVVLENIRSLRIAVSGEVSSPGIYTLTADEGQFPTVVQALQAAGGVTQAANLRRVELRRASDPAAVPNQTVPNQIEINLWALLNNGDVQQDVALRDGDAIVITPTESVDIAESNRLESDQAERTTPFQRRF